MSYCRFSTDDFKSNVYCYKHVNQQYVITVAGLKYDYDTIDLPPDVHTTDFEARYNRNLEVMEILEDEPLEPIGLPHDGEIFYVESLEEMEEKLQELDDMGYYIPQIAYKRINDEKTE